MDGFTEKKWFVYVSDHHEGPFSLAEIQNKIATGQVTSANYVWCEGMADWKPMTDVPEFESVLGGAAAVSASPAMPRMASGGGDASPVLTTRNPERSLTNIQLQPQEQNHGAQFPSSTAADSAPVASSDEPAGKSRLAGVRRLLPLIVVAALVVAYLQGVLDPILKNPAVDKGISSISAAIQPALFKLGEKVPAIGKFISPIPMLEDVKPEDFEKLKAAASKSTDQGPAAMMVLSQADLFSPVFYIATNLPDGATFDVFIEGVGDTLLNQTSFSARSAAVVQKRLAKSEPIKLPDGKHLPRGQYQVTAALSMNQPAEVKAIADKATAPPKLPEQVPAEAKASKVAESQIFFLGGPKDAIYTQRLKEFHDKLNEKAKAELAEAHQFSTLLEQQLNGTLAKFGALRKPGPRFKLTPAIKKDWNAFHETFSKMGDELGKSYAKWTPEALQNEYFYGMIYPLITQAGQAVDKVHGLQHAFMTGTADMASFDIQLGEATAAAQGAVTALKAKVDQAEKLGPTPNGMPRKDGL